MTLRQANAAAMPPGPNRLECIEPLNSLQAEQLLLKLVPTVRYPELMALATACGCVPLTLHAVAGAMKKQKLTTQVLPFLDAYTLIGLDNSSHVMVSVCAHMFI